MDLNFIFFNQVGRLRSGWRFGVFAALFLFLLIFFETWFQLLLGDAPESRIDSRLIYLSRSLYSLAAAVLVGWFCTKIIEGLPFRALGWNLTGNWWRDAVLGVLFGAGSMFLATAVAALGGGLTLTFNSASSDLILQTALTSAAIFAFAAAFEEALFRGYALQTFMRAGLFIVGTIVTSFFFSLAHSSNQNVTFFGLLNTALAGIWFAIAYLKTRNLWFAATMHFSWNWTMAAVLGLPVSGITQITPEPILRGVDGGSAWLTGGSYGLEGGVACTIALVVSTAAIWFAPFLKPDAEMLALTSHANPVSSEKI